MHWAPEKFAGFPDLTAEFEDGQALSDMVHVYDVSGKNCRAYNDMSGEHLLITC